jgi:peptidoglycan/LPS O-acetylase OafA/YrhL
MHYRAEIDGLRAIAVISVILYHAEFLVFNRDWFQGGFVGVDVFFVISGYLITHIIVAELYEKNSFSFAKFYERRARRIAPALGVVILASFPFAWASLLPVDFVDYSKSILAAVFFGSNFFFYFTTTQYGADAALLEPFLHTWSLGIEEQFYIMFPLLLVAVRRYAKNYLLILILALLLLSLQFANHIESRNAELSFYLPFSRFWELLIGSVLACVELKHGRVKIALLNNLLPLVGLFLILYAIFRFDSSTPHPSYMTLIPVVGVAGIIAFSSTQDFVGKMLGSKALVSVGLVSYSAYLWHFPIFAFSRISGSVPTNVDKLVWITFTFVLSLLSYYAIEKPFRKNALVSSHTLWRVMFFSVALVIMLHALVIVQDGFAARLPPILASEELSQKPWLKLKSVKGEPCNNMDINRQVKECSYRLGSSDEKPSGLHVVLLGDSHLSSIADDLVSRRRNNHVITLLRDGCPFYLGATRVASDGKRSDCTAEFQNNRLRLIKEIGPDVAVIYGRYPLFFEERWFNNQEGGVESEDFLVIDLADDVTSKAVAVTRGLEEILNLGISIIMVYPSPEVGWNVPKRLMEKLPNSIAEIDAYLQEHPITTSAAVYYERTKSSFQVFDSIEHPNFHRVYPHKLFCNSIIDGRCVTHDLENIFYADDDHLSSRGAEMVNDLILQKLHQL